MNASLWQLAGWTMIHSLWLGASVALAGGFLRLACRRATPNTRYAISLATLALLAAAPIAAAAWLNVNGVPAIETVLLPLPLGEGWGEGQPRYTASHLSLPLKGREPEGQGSLATTSVIDLAQATPAELDALAAQQQPPQALPTNSPASFPLAPSPLPLPPSDHQSPITSHSPTTYSPTHLLTSSLTAALPLLPTLWLIGAPLTFTLLATGLIGSERLRRRATPLTAGIAFDACQRLRHTLTITRRVALAVSDDVAQPILVGIVRPLILLPAAALAGWTPEQLDMVLLHELAHVRRWDNLINLLQRIVESLLFFHPAVWLVSRQVRRDREECCDAAVIRHTDRPHQYAELLVSIAAALRGGPAPSLAVASAMASHPLAGRIRRILNIEAEPMRITRRTLAATLLLPLLIACAIFYSGASAEDGNNPPPSKGAEQRSTVAGDDRAQGDSPPEAIRGGIPDVDQSNAANGNQASSDALAPETASESNQELPTLVHDPATDLWHPETDRTSPSTQESKRSKSQLEARISELQQLLKKTETEIAELQIFVDLKQLLSPRTEHIDQFLRESSKIDPEVVAAEDLRSSTTLQLQRMLGPAVPIDAAEVQRLQTLRDETTQKIKDLQERFVKVQRKKLDAIPESDFPKVSAANIRKHQELQIKRDVYKLDLALAEKLLSAAKAPPAHATNALNEGAPAAARLPQLGWNESLALKEIVIPFLPDFPDSDQERERIRKQLEADNFKANIATVPNSEAPTYVLRVFVPRDWNPKPVWEEKMGADGTTQKTLRLINEKMVPLPPGALVQPAGHPDSPNQGGEDTGIDASSTDAQGEIPQLQNEIRNLEALIAKTQADLVNIEVFKEISSHSGPGNSALEAAVAEELDRDPTINQYHQQLRELQATHQAKQAESKNSNSLEIKRLRASMQAAEAELAKHRSEAESELREKIAKMPNEALRSAMTEYKIRRKSIEDNLAGYQQELIECKQKLKAVNARLSDLQAIGTYATPTIAAADAIQHQIKNQNPTANASPDSAPLTQKPETPANAPAASYASNSDRVTEREAWKLRRLFKESDSNERITKFYAVPRESRQELETAIGVEASNLFGAYRPPFHLEWKPGEDAVYVTASSLAHRGYFRVVFAANALGQFGYPPDPQLPAYQAALQEMDEAQADAARALEGLSPTQSPASPFPTLENQKIADRAYKLLGLDLDPLSAEDLERVKKLGYSGGLKVAQVIGETGGANGRLQVGNLLVGLHVWPVIDLASLDEIMRRPDLGELTPLKYYAVRMIDPNRDASDDELTTGRLSIPEAALLSRDLETADRMHAEIAAVRVPSDSAPVTVIQPPISQKTSIFGGAVTTAYLKVKFDRLPYSLDDANGRLTPQELERNSMNCLAVIKSPNVLKAALDVITPREVADIKPEEALLWLMDRLSVTFPGDGEILELKLEGGDAKEDKVLLQAVIDAFIAAMNMTPESPADPNAAAVPPGYLSPYPGSNFNLASAAAEYPEAFANALEQSRQAGQPVIVHFLAHDSEPSQRFVDDVLADEQVVKFIDEHFIPVTIYADDEPALAKKFQVSRVPANFFVFNGNARTGGFAVPATPLAYIVQLQQMYNITTNLASSPIPGEPMPATPPVPVADRPGNDQKPTATLDAGDAVALKVAGAFPEAPLDGVFAIEPAGTLPLGPLYGRVAIAGKTVLEAEAAVKEHLSKTLTDVAVQLTLAPNPATTASDVAAHRNSALSPVEINGLRFLKVFPPSTDVKEISALAERLRGEGNVVTVSLDEDGSTRLTAAQKIEPTPVDPSEPTTRPTFLYDGKTFDQWRDLWKLELNPERRIEAINAMAAFSRAGRGDEALNAILDVAAEYDFSTIDPDDPEGKLQERIIKLFTDYPGAGAYQDPWLPIVLDRMQAAPDKWRPLVDMLLYRCMPPHRTQYPGSPPIMSAANVELLKKAVGDERLDAKILFLTTLNNVAAHDPDVVRMTKEALQSDDVESALKLLSSISFANVDKLPEQLEFLFAAESATRQTARDALARSSGPQVRDAVADKLLAILNDANQSARHADAIRALAMFSGNIHPMSRGQNLSPQKRQEIIDALDKVSREGTPDLLPPALAALQLIYTDPDNSQASARSAFNAERLKLLDDSKPEIEEEKQSLLNGTALGEQRGGGFF